MVFLSKSTVLSSYTYIPLQSHERRDEAFSNSLWLLSSHLYHAQQFLDTDVETALVATEAGLLEHLHRLLTLARVLDKVNFVKDDFQRAQAGHWGDADLGVEALGQSEICQDRAQRGRGDDEETTTLRWTLGEQDQQRLQNRVGESGTDRRKVCDEPSIIGLVHPPHSS